MAGSYTIRLLARVTLVVAISLALRALASGDEGGVPFWTSGQYASVAAVPQAPGWYLPTMFYYYSGSAGRTKSFPRGVTLSTGLRSRSPTLFLTPTFVPDVKLLDGRPAVSLTAGAGYDDTAADLAVSASGTRTFNRTDTLWGATDLYPAVSLAWTHAVHNWMVYGTGDIPVGSYDSARLANLGIGHGAVDGGGGYTYLNTKTGTEASAVVGFTYNLENPSTQYKNGVDFHLDYAISQFLSEHFHVGVVGYLYNQLSPDSGSGAKLGPFESKVAAVGGELGYFFQVFGQQWYANVRGYYEFWAENRLQGFSVFATINIPLSFGKK